MTSRNPFEPSRAILDIAENKGQKLGDGVTLWRDDRAIVLLPGARMPARCVKCNEQADEPTVARKLYWYAPWLYLLLLLNIILFAVVTLIVRKKTIVAAGLCAEHKRRRRKVIALAWVGALSGLVVIYGGMASPIGVWGAVLGILITIGSIAAGIIFGRVVYAVKIDDRYVRLKGCGERFLESLPPFPG